MLVTLLRATPNDSQLLWELANDPATRAAAFQSNPIAWADHQAWFADHIGSPSSVMLIAEVDGRPVGQIRFDIGSNGTAEIDLSVAPPDRGRGYGTAIIRAGCEFFERQHPIMAIAHVRRENLASLRAFERAGFQRIGPETVGGHQSVRLERAPQPGPNSAVRYIVAARGSWNRAIFDADLATRPGEWVLVDAPDQLTSERVSAVSPRYIFFLHWSWKVPADIVRDYECIGFHMTDLPYGRGGSPLQNLILQGRTTTMLTAFRLGEGFDAGPIYLKEPLSLEGRAQEIYERASRLATAMIGRILAEGPMPVPQQGEVVAFRRRSPEESRIPDDMTLHQLYDFIRMLDADGYPLAFAEVGDWRCEFSEATLQSDRVDARVRFTRRRESDRA